MRIITSGQEGKRAEPFWAQQPITCSNCLCEFEVDADEQASPVFKEANLPPMCVYVGCPHCTKRVRVPNPENVGETLDLGEQLRREQIEHNETVALYNKALVRISELEEQIAGKR